MNKLYLLTIILAGLFIVACGGDDDPMMNTCETEGLTYTNDIAAIVNSSCATSVACHGASTAYFPMDNYASLTEHPDFGRLSGSINHSANFSPMPKGGNKLDDCTIDKIDQWINDGSPE